MEFAVSREESEIMTDTQVMAALEPCPVSWCEDSRPHVFKVTSTLCGVRCNECGTKTPGYWTESEAVAAWNLRIASSPAAEPVAWMYSAPGNTVFAEKRNDLLAANSPPDGEWTETPLYAALPPAGDAALRRALDEIASKSWRGTTIADLQRIARAALATPPSVPAQQGEEDWGCDYCRNDGKLNENNCCPECDAQYPWDEPATPPAQDQKGEEEWDGPLTAEEQAMIDAAWEKHKAAAPQDERQDMTDDQIKHMTERFLSWKLPANFSPDAGISFNRVSNIGTPYEYAHQPTGTNLLDYTQAEAMIRHMLEGLPATPPAQDQTKGDESNG